MNFFLKNWFEAFFLFLGTQIFNCSGLGFFSLKIDENTRKFHSLSEKSPGA